MKATVCRGEEREAGLEEESEEEVGSGFVAPEGESRRWENEVQIDGDSFSRLGNCKVLSSQASCC